MKVPVLILHDEQDKRVPIALGEQFYGALKSNGTPVQMVRFQNFFLDRYAEAYRREMDHFADMLDGADASVGYADGVNALALAEAAAESVKTGAPVRL